MANIAEIKQVIAAADVCGHVPLVKGVHGLGKSESVTQYAKEQDMHYEPLILSLMDTGDMLGLPETRNVGGMSATIWAAPSWYNNIVNAAWPMNLEVDRLQFNDLDFQKAFLDRTTNAVVNRSELNDAYCDYYRVPNDRVQLLRQENVAYLDSRRSVLFLDEFNRAPADILNASLQLILDHKLHSHELPIVRGQETLIVAAINPADGDYTVQEFDAALLDRFVSCEVKPDFKSWLKWAKANNVNQIVTDFLIDNQNRFHMTPKDGEKGTSPRSWTRLGTYIDRIEDTPKDIFTTYLNGTIGSKVAAQFLMFYNEYGNGVTIKDIEKLVKKEITKFKKAKKDLNPEELAACLEKTMEKLEAVRKIDFAEALTKDYISKEGEKALPFLTYLYALPVESLSAVLKSLQTENLENYTKLAALDKAANNKKLFIKLVANLKGN